MPKATESGGDSAPIICLTGFEPAETLHQIKGRAVDLDRINRRPPPARAVRASVGYLRRGAA